MRIPSQLLSDLHDYQAWRSNSAEFDLLDYVLCVATPDLLFGFMELLFPSLLLHDGNYFLASHFRVETYDEWMRKLHDPVAVQKVMNHRHLSTLFQQRSVSDAVAREAAQRIAACWSTAFKELGLVAETYGETFDDAEFTLFRRPIGETTQTEEPPGGPDRK